MRRVRPATPDSELSITLVVRRHLRNRGDSPRRLMVKVSSRRAAADRRVGGTEPLFVACRPAECHRSIRYRPRCFPYGSEGTHHLACARRRANPQQRAELPVGRYRHLSAYQSRARTRSAGPGQRPSDVSLVSTMSRMLSRPNSLTAPSSAPPSTGGSAIAENTTPRATPGLWKADEFLDRAGAG